MPRVEWAEPAARAGYAAKGAVYALIGVLAIREALGAGGGASGGREAVRRIGEGPFGQVLLVLLCLGLGGYVLWRLVQAVLDPDASSSDSRLRRVGMRAFYVLSALLYGTLAFYALQLLLGSGGGGGEGEATRSWTARLMSRAWGQWLVGAVGVGIVGRGALQFVKAYTASFRKRIRSFDLGPVRGRWAVAASRIGLSARGVIFVLIGGYLVYAALRQDPSRARGLEGVLASLGDRPWLLGGVGAGLVCYAIYQWVKAKYRLIGV